MKVVFFCIFWFSASILFAQGIAINETGDNPDASAILDVKSTDKGFLTSRLTTAQRDAIASPAQGLIIYNTDVQCIQFYNGTSWRWFSSCSTVASLDCAGATINGTLVEGEAASGVSAEIDYTGGSGAPHNGQTVNSTGVTGLTATLTAGDFASGSGTLTYSITGTPSSDGTASFEIEIGGVTCTLEITIESPYPPGYVHCGDPTEVVEVYNPDTDETWMDRNLGASQVATSSTDTDAYGDLFQWGRGADGHQCRSSSTTFTRVATDQPGHGDFITNTSTSPFDWRNPQNDNLWQGQAGVNNPCPTGFRIPTEAELDAERLSWVSNNAAGAFGSPLKLTVAGLRATDGFLYEVGNEGSYWSSTIDGVRSRYLRFRGVDSDMFPDDRAAGKSVRCIKD